jgi:hypothetical protein
MNKYELTQHLVVEVLQQWEAPSDVEISARQHAIAHHVTQTLIKEGVIQSTIENDLSADVA